MYTSCIHGEIPRENPTLRGGLELWLKYHLQLKPKEERHVCRGEARYRRLKAQYKQG